MRTSEEIYHRVRWDARFDPARFVLGVRQRGAADKRVPLPSFSPGGEIPWHRVEFVEADGELVWDRASGLDRLDSAGLGRVRAELRLRAPHFIARTPHRFDPARGAWCPAAGGPGRLPDAGAGLRVLTWNALWDRYDADRIDSARRRPMLLAALAAADADVMALQEVDAGLLRVLLDAPWIRAGYTVAGDPGVRAVEETGLLLLSRLPVREAATRSLGPHKGLLAATVEAPGGPVVVGVTHLSSDHSPAGADRRRAELALIVEGLAGVEGEVVLVGDVNDGGPGPAAALRLADAWSLTHGAHDATPTFDPVANPLAAVSSLTGRASRLDRVLLRPGALRPSSVRLLGELPDADGWFASDHYGLLADLTAGAAGTDATSRSSAGVLDVPPTARTALAWLPPRDVWPLLDAIRRRHDPQADRWPPHVNVLFGFVPESRFDAALPLLSAAAAEVPPFAAVLSGVHSFAHRDDATVWLDPAAGGSAGWGTLRHALERRFPGCRGRDEGWTPHLTLGRTREPARLAAECAARLGDLACDVGELAVLSRRADEPFALRAVVTLGTGAVRWVEAGATPADGSGSRSADGTGYGSRSADGSGTGSRSAGGNGPAASPDGGVARVVGAVREVAEAMGGVAHVVGSRRMGCELPDADVDLVLVVPGAADAGAVRERLAGALPDGVVPREVIGARVPGLRWRAEGVSADLVLVGAGKSPVGHAVRRRAELGEAAAIALSAVSDADAIVDAVGGTAPHPAFAATARAVKAWARARGLDSAPFGGLPGLAWSVLAARSVLDAPDDPAPLTRFFGTWAAWDWRKPVALRGEPSVRTSDALTVLTPSAPVRSCTAQVGRAMRELLTAELYRAWELLESGGDPAVLLTPAVAHRAHAAWAVVTVSAVGGEEFGVTLGRFRGRARALLQTLEDGGVTGAHAWPRPFDSRPGQARYAVGLGPTPPDAARLAALTHRWARGLPGVTVDRADGGAVPTLT